MELRHIELLGEKHPLCFSMSAAQNLTRHFGSMEEMGEQILNEDVSVRRAAVVDVLTEMIRAGRVYAKAMGYDVPRQIPCDIADIIEPDTVPLVGLILSVLRRDSSRDVEIEGAGKNGGATISK